MFLHVCELCLFFLCSSSPTVPPSPVTVPGNVMYPVCCLLSICEQWKMAINQSELMYSMFSIFLICVANINLKLHSIVSDTACTCYYYIVVNYCQCTWYYVDTKYYKIDCITEKYYIRFYVQIIVRKIIKSGRCWSIKYAC